MPPYRQASSKQARQAGNLQSVQTASTYKKRGPSLFPPISSATLRRLTINTQHATVFLLLLLLPSRLPKAAQVTDISERGPIIKGDLLHKRMHRILQTTGNKRQLKLAFKVAEQKVVVRKTPGQFEYLRRQQQENGDINRVSV
jgi:hypothetical protein